MKYSKSLLVIVLLLGFFRSSVAFAQTEEEAPAEVETVDSVERIQSQDLAILDDKMLLQGYTEKYREYSRDIIFAMIEDDTLDDIKMAAAVRVLNQQYIHEIVYREKKIVERMLWRRLNRTTSPFVQVETMNALLVMERYHYFKSLAPQLIQKLNHYNSTVNEFAFTYLEQLTSNGNSRPREARIVFNTLRKMLFLSRKRLANVTTPDQRLKYKIKLLRWSIKVLGTEELKRLPKEVINLL